MWRGGSRWEAAGSSFIIKAHSQLDGANATRTLESASDKQARRVEDEEGVKCSYLSPFLGSFEEERIDDGDGVCLDVLICPGRHTQC